MENPVTVPGRGAGRGHSLSTTEGLWLGGRFGRSNQGQRSAWRGAGARKPECGERSWGANWGARSPWGQPEWEHVAEAAGVGTGLGPWPYPPGTHPAPVRAGFLPAGSPRRCSGPPPLPLVLFAGSRAPARPRRLETAREDPTGELLRAHPSSIPCYCALAGGRAPSPQLPGSSSAPCLLLDVPVFRPPRPRDQIVKLREL